MNNYKIWLLEYAKAMEQPYGSFLDGGYNQGSVIAPFCFGVIKSEDHNIMIDVGYDYKGHNKYLADISGCSMWQPVEKILEKIDLKPDDIDIVFITHAHFDHMGNIHSFPNAHFYIQKREVDKWIWAKTLPNRFEWIKRPVNSEDLFELLQLTDQGRLTLVEGYSKNILPGISLIPAYDTHSFGCQYVVVGDTSDGETPWIFVGDNLFNYRNVSKSPDDDTYTPIGFCQGSKTNTLLSIDEILNIVNRDEKKLILFHENKSWEVFPSWEGTDGLHVAEVKK